MSNENKCGCNSTKDEGKFADNETLEIMERFRKFYQGKLRDIEQEGGGDCLELKVKVQEKWIKDLTEQTEMMARIVKELEVEATERVQMLEEKLRQSSKAAYEVMKRYQSFSCTHNLDEPFQKVFYLENDVKNLLEFVRRVRVDGKWSIDGLQFYDITYSDLFGSENNNNVNKADDVIRMDSTDQENPKDDEEKIRMSAEIQFINQQLKAKDEECENLRKSMVDMRSALTEEVACKHDTISALRKDILQLEERCLQADKQTAFKDDIIKELRKEIKLLKQQHNELEEERQRLTDEVQQLQNDLKKANKKIAMYEDSWKNNEAVNNNSKLIRNKDEIIELQNNTLNVIQTELQESRKRDQELNRRNDEICKLKCICADLENELEDTKGRADNLQKAVDLYLNSINVLEATEEKSKIELEQQRITINNLQEALVNVKQELDELRDKNQQDVENYESFTNVLFMNLSDLEEKNQNLEMKISELATHYKNLQDLHFNLEIEHFNNLQDLAIFETQTYKYQNEIKQLEGSKMVSKSELKKLRQQKRCYEHVVDCFKQEMTVMSEQLAHLQEILNLSNKSSKEESSQLHNTVADLQELNERLKRELIETEQKVLVENHMNQMKDAQIGELQQIIGQKNADLSMHDEAIHEMKLRLENATIENHELQSTIVSLNSTVMQLQLALQNNELNKKDQCKVETCASQLSVCQKGISDIKEDLCKKSNKLSKIERDYKIQKDMLLVAQKELEETKEKNREKCKCLKMQNELLKDKVDKYEQHIRDLKNDLARIKAKTGHLIQRENCREQELSQYKQIVIELRQTLIEINENLSSADLEHIVFDEAAVNVAKENRQTNDIYSSCRCEINLYKKLIENFKIALMQATEKIVKLGDQNKSLRDELKVQENQRAELQKRLAKKEKENCEHVKELVEKLEESKAEEKRLTNFVDKLRQEIQKKIDEHSNMVKIPEEEEDPVATQEEISLLKAEINKMIQNQYSLNAENDKLLTQITRLQGIIGPTEESARLLREKLGKALDEIQILKETNKSLINQKDKLTNELQILQVAYNKLEKNYKFVKESARNLEMELAETRNVRDDVCAESKHVVNNVKQWLEEQRKINQQVKKKAQGYCQAIEKLKRDNEARLQQNRAATPQTCPQTCGQPRFRPKNNDNPQIYSPPMEFQQNSWGLGSQGTGSLTDRDSPRDSPSSFLTCSVEEWYSPNYRDDDDTDYNEDGFVDRIEQLTIQMRDSNKKWKSRCHDCYDDKK